MVNVLCVCDSWWRSVSTIIVKGVGVSASVVTSALSREFGCSRLSYTLLGYGELSCYVLWYDGTIRGNTVTLRSRSKD